MIERSRPASEEGQFVAESDEATSSERDAVNVTMDPADFGLSIGRIGVGVGT